MKPFKVVRDAAMGFLMIAVLLAVGFGGGYAYRQYTLEKNAEVVDNSHDPGLQLPGEAEKRIVTTDEVQAKLIEIDQLATYSGEYSVTKSADYTRHILDDIPVPGTTNSIALDCTGVVKVGYGVGDIVPKIDDESQKIYIALPTPAVLDNYVIWDSVQYAESNNILNPIDFAQYQTLIQEIEEEGLAKAEEKGIYEAAEENVKMVIQNFLAGFEGYEVMFL